MKTIKLLTAICLFCFVASCAKDGPQGPEGPQGNAGPQGNTGPQGPQGQPGTANVIYSAWLSATTSKDSTVDNSLLKVAYIAAPKLTSEILSNAAILVYLDFGTIMPLPYTSGAGFKTSTISFIPMKEKICITRFTHDNSGSLSLPAHIKYRYIIIPGGTTGRMAVPQVDFSDYRAVCSYYHIPE